MKFSKLLIFTCLMILLQGLWACNNYKMKWNYIKNCGGDDRIIKVYENSTVQLTKNCEYNAKTCVTFKKYTKAIVQFTVFKDNITVFRATHDVCQKNKKKSEVLTIMMLHFGIPTKCPMEAGTFCQKDIKYLLSPAATKMIGLTLGGVEVEAKIEHNDNGKSCMLLDALYSK